MNTPPNDLSLTGPAALLHSLPADGRDRQGRKPRACTTRQDELLSEVAVSSIKQISFFVSPRQLMLETLEQVKFRGKR